MFGRYAKPYTRGRILDVAEADCIRESSRREDARMFPLVCRAFFSQRGCPPGLDRIGVVRGGVGHSVQRTHVVVNCGFATS